MTNDTPLQMVENLIYLLVQRKVAIAALATGK